MKTKKILFIFLCLVCSISLFSCGSKKDTNQVRAIFSLEGGVCQTSTSDITHVYTLNDKEDTFIVDPSGLDDNEITKKREDGKAYRLVGWYKNKQVNGDVITYSDPWDFSKDKMTKDGITLYAYWKITANHTYNLCYVEEDKEISLGSYEVNEGATFRDRQNYANRKGYTSLGFFEDKECETPWNTSFKHPGGEEDREVKVYTKYIEGEFSLVSTLNDLRRCKSNNIYLMNDIDLKGETFNFGDYDKIFIGNNHTIKNFSLAIDTSRGGLRPVLDEIDNSYSAKNSLYISLFPQLKNATIKDVTFDNVTFEVKTSFGETDNIYISPLAVNCVNAQIENVHFNGKFILNETPVNCNLIIEQNNLCYHMDNLSNIASNSSVNIELIDNRNS